jgi:hypothetical protein
MSYNKNVVEDALFQIKNLEDVLQENAKGILQSTMSEEIRQLVKESLREQDGIKQPTTNDGTEGDDQMNMGPEEMDDEEDMEMDDEEDMEMDDKEDMEMDDKEDMEMDDKEDMEMDDEEDMEMDDEEDAIDMTDASDEEVLRVFKAMGDDDGIVVKKEGNYIHLTDDDDEYMIQLEESYNELDEEAMENIYEIEMDDETNEMMDSDETIYEIEMSGISSEMDEMDHEMYEMDHEMDEMDHEMYEMDHEMYEMDHEMDEMDHEMYEMDHEMYEMDHEMDKMNDYMMESKRSMKSKKSIKPKDLGIGKGPKFGYDKKPNMSGGFNTKRKEAFGKGIKAMGTGKAKFEYEEGENMKKGKNTIVKKMETKEASRTLGSGSNFRRGGLPKARAHSSFNTAINEELELMKEKNNEYKKALDVFRTKLNEVAVFNSNLAYATRLFTEHSTTKQEKINILRRFDNVETLKESKNLYRTIKSELGSGSTHENKLNESVDKKINRTVESGSSVNLIESKTYENPQFLRMKDLMTKLK